MSITDRFLNDVEGHLLLAATREEGRTAAARFSAPLHWLTEGQRDEVERRFEAEYLALARASWQHTAARAGGLRDAYEARYRDLRRRLLAGWLLTCVLALGVLVVCLA
ncbi:hypothetical protein ACM01_00555 [Streptomyces viridochromogenes]|uniref:Cytochrome C oxidase subunit I n=1 Tax=Streptomyces viridochromogenes TaxID=1938 RepID=A0A0J7ZMI8_STRVR|nr:hypothetical protein [Streptomyces viridochromogenes]KMS77164.1 hypothetical protein ACM01_00555 [Streptomyces viridochromogenes]KOG09408.1 hypothetical protein ADK35_40300 [Streptomyces viridochromogenes]KOG27314.1 hypothetical protein ADK36_01865 [Streptomyces viridochromogenes]